MISCIICGKNNWQPKYNKLLVCKTCGLVRAENRYFSQSNSKLYNDYYFNGLDYLNYELERSALVKNFSNRMKQINNYYKRGRLLEIGCAYGYFLSLASKSFKTTGIDLNQSITKIAKKNSPKSEILTGDFTQKKFINDYNVVCMFDVIEHLKDPRKYLLRIHKLMKSNGIVVIETGNISALLPRIQKSKWRLITPPTHLYYFDKKSVKNLLVSLGYENIVITNVTFNRTLGQVIYRLIRKNLPFFSNITIPTYTGDLMLIIAQKV